MNKENEMNEVDDACYDERTNGLENETKELGSSNNVTKVGELNEMIINETEDDDEDENDEDDDDDDDDDEDDEDDDDDQYDDDDDDEDDDDDDEDDDDNEDDNNNNEDDLINLQIDEDPYLLKDASYIKKNELWKNRQRVLIVRSPLKKKGCKSFIDNLKLLLPHHKMENKWDKKVPKSELNDISYSRNCNNIIFFDVKRKRYCLWICKSRTGPSLYFEILDYIPLHSLLFSGNCLLYSRPLLIFSKHFDELDHLKLIKEMFIHVFGVPNYHPLSKPFYDHCYNFFYVNDLIYFRHYQILPITLADSNNVNKQQLVEIGPQFTLHIIKIFEECFKGRILYENEKYRNYVTPQQVKLNDHLKKKIKNMKKKKNKYKKFKFIKPNIKTDIDY
ncbi:ribosome biogenesis protein BRX1 homolog, putative [Plasmodium sp. DRC-Itaito]|nr:ribosome biogenesis protein BRX1 homolog, putative [Plasmodium sp. DRC-Itaito]